MIMNRITMHVLKEKQKEVMQTLLSMIEPMGKENGCLSYHVFQDIENQNVFSLLGEWNTREDMDNHIKSDRFGLLLGIRSLLCEPLTIQIHTASNSEGMEMVNTLRSKGL
jgi:quinol monooxygenase YgiN